MLCQMAENEGVELAGEAGVFPSLLPDNAPSGAGELLPPTPCQSGEQTLAERLTGKNGVGWELGNELGRYHPRQNNKVKTCVEAKTTERREPEATTLRLHIDPHIEVRYEA